MTINVSGYTTNPTSLTSCTQIYSGIPVTGIRLALYNVSGGLPTSPAGYTSLIACREFSGDGSLTSFSGLASNTNYLLMVEGIENTKANFTFSFSGTAISDGANLPLSNLMLTGNADGKEINLQFTAVNEQDIRFYELERSADGISFSKFGEIQAISSSFVGNRVYKFIDKQPIVGKNYYRIKAISQNNQIQYSNIFFVNLNQKIASFSVTPNPIEGKQLELKSWF
jgi:ribosomal protein L24